MITIDFLKNHPQAITQLIKIRYEVLGRIWLPDVSDECVHQWMVEHMNDNKIPLTLIALSNGQPVGMCSLRGNDGIRPDLMPWLGSLTVDPDFQNQGIGKQLIDATRALAKKLGFNKLFLFAFDPTIPDYYQKLGWEAIGMDHYANHPVTVMACTL